MKLLGADTNSGMIRKISDWFGMNFNLKQFHSDLIRRNFSIRSIRDPFKINSNESDQLELIRINPDLQSE